MPATVVLMIDGLSAYMPGPYGNTSVDTPSLNRFASESALFDFCFCESPLLSESCGILWRDLPMDGSVLAADSQEVLTLAGGQGFERVMDAVPPDPTQSASSVAETQTAAFFTAAIEALQDLDDGSLCWLHHQGLYGSWDAPWELRRGFADEEDPDPPTSVERPVGKFDAKLDDPDVMLGYQQSAYAQLVVIDQLFGVFIDQLRDSGMLEQISVILAAPRGYALGEHGNVGEVASLYSEMIHVPLMIRGAGNDVSGRLPKCSRHGGMIQFQQLNRLIHALLDGKFHSIPFCEQAVSRVGQKSSLRTAEWKMIRDLERPDTVELYAKPDDRWDINDVSRRCAHEIEQLMQLV